MKINNNSPIPFLLPTLVTRIPFLFSIVESFMSCFRKYIILLSLLPLCVSCGTSPPREIIAKSIIKLDGSNTTIKDLLEIDGYYVIGGIEAEITPTADRLIFFEDGTYAFNFIFKSGLAIENIVGNLSESIRRYNYGSKGDLWVGHMGVYRIEGDMIIGHLYRPPYNTGFLYLGPGWGIWEEGYKIVNRTTLKRVYFRSLLKANENTTLGKTQWVNDPPYNYISATPPLREMAEGGTLDMAQRIGLESIYGKD